MFCSYLKAIQLTTQNPFPSMSDTSPPCRSNAKDKKHQNFQKHYIFSSSCFFGKYVPKFTRLCGISSQKMKSQLAHHASACEMNKNHFQQVAEEKFSIIQCPEEYLSLHLRLQPHFSGMSVHVNRMPGSDKSHLLLWITKSAANIFICKNTAPKCY